MKFYILKTDEAFEHYPMIKSWFQKVDFRNFNRRDAHRIPDRQLLYIHESSNTVFTSIIDNPFPLVSAEVRDVFDMYEPHIIYKELVLLDAVNERTSIYYLPILEEVDCLDERSELNLDRSILRRGIINYKKTAGKAIFWLGGVGRHYMVGRIDLVESILKRNVRGIGLEELELCNGGV